MDCTVVHYEPFLALIILAQTLLFCHIIHLLSYSGEQLSNEINEFVLSVCTFNDSPMGQTILSNNGYQRKSFAFVDRAVHSDLFVRPCPGFISGHV